MAEALGLASGVAGLVSLGLTVCQGLLRYYGSWKDSEADVASMISSIHNLSETLTHLDRRITAANPSSDTAKEMQQSVDTCQATFQKLDAKLKKINEKVPPGSHGKLERHIRKAMYPFKASTLAKLQETTTDARQNLHLALSVMHFETTSVAAQKLDDVTAGIAQIHIAIALMKLNRDIRDWLDPPDPSSSYNTAASKRSLGTGNWFVDGPYNLWFTQPSSFYWLQGGPGCGKTVLSSTVVTATSLATKQEPSQPILYYYFDFQYPEKQVADNLIRSLIYQLANQNAETRPPLEQLFEDHGHGLRRPSSSNLLGCLKDMLETPSLKYAYIILDALDECKELPELLKILTTIRSWRETRLRLLVTSRPERVIRENIASLDPVAIMIQSDIVDIDIKTHVIGIFNKDSWWEQWSAPIRNSVILTLTRRAKGMFRWVIAS
ncbi:hypothetical protein GJ744_004614 [Endocarpon pusillum]|uniref:NACHT domain-containing protein n=1 Tax=Endocarpon pusillum TaxID=364733 RepID=A0A8H7ALL4_9EURO|nr:hypothetical protein GJ744_004614 [Endocarpon pusillum]